MSGSNKKKRSLPTQQPVTSATQSNTIHSLLDCYDFLATNEYSDKTIGIQAFLTRKSVGDINFSDIIDDSEKRSRSGQQTNFTGILEDKRDNLPEIDASIEKCLMLDRLIHYIKENETRFARLISDTRLDMQYKMTDEQFSPNSYDFTRREYEFNTRKNAQEIRRLFYQNDAEVNNPKNLVYLQSRTTEHLKSLMTKISTTTKTRQSQPLNNEFEAVFRSSFMIVSQPHSGVNPVTIYERKGPGEYTAKISVIIISLLYDFMQLYPDVIELYDIEPSLCPSSDYYKLEEPRSISWKACQVQTGGGKYRTFLCAEVSFITIEQSSKSDTRVRFAQLLHSFKFAIKLQLNILDSKTPPVFQFALESLVFGIGAHNNQIPQLLTRVILEDIKRCSRNKPINVETILYFLQRYFIHRTGVAPNSCINIYIEQELSKAKIQRNNSQLLEDIYLDFLVNFVYQVEFMAKHPILAMFHADGLFLGICNSERAAEAIVQSSVSDCPVIGLRFNTIRIDYSLVASAVAASRSVKLAPCAVRVDIYNDRTKKLQNRTFDSSTLATDISRFVTTAETENASRIRILSNFDDRANGRTYLSFNEFSKYYDKRLQKLLKDDEKYKPVTDLVENANDGNADDDNSEINSQHSQQPWIYSPDSNTPWSPVQLKSFEADNSRDACSVHDYGSIGYDSSNHTIASPQNIVSPSNRPPSQPTSYANNHEAILKQLLSRPDIAEQVVRQYGRGNFSMPLESSPQILTQVPTQQQQQQQQQQQIPMQFSPQMTYQPPGFQPIHHPHHQPQTQFQQTQTPFQQTILQQHSPQMQYQQHSPQMQYQQHSPQMQYQQHSPQMQYQQTVVQQQTHMPFVQPLIQQQQQQTASSVIHYHPNTIDQPSSTKEESDLLSFITSDVTENIAHQFYDQINISNPPGINSNELNINPIPQRESPAFNNDPKFLEILEGLKNSGVHQSNT